MSNTGVSFKIGADNSDALKALKDLGNEFKTLRNELKSAVTDIKIKVSADSAALGSEISTIKNQIKSQIGQIEVDVKVKADNATIAASAEQIKNQLRTAVGHVDVQLKISANPSTLNAELLQIKNRVNAYFASGLAVRIVPTLTAADAATLHTRLNGLTNTTFQAKVGINLAYLNAQIAHARSMLSGLGSGVNINIDATASNLIHALNELKAEIVHLRTSLSSGGGGGGGGPNGGGAGNVSILAGLSGRLAGLAAGYVSLTSIVAAFNKTISAQREFDILNAQLETATKSSENAKIAFAALQDFAKKTPYDLKQAVDGFTKLVNLGLTPSERALTSYGNTAAAMGKDLMQFIEAVADASTSEFERLKEFGIKSKQEGDKVSFTFQGVTKTIGNNAKEIEEYLIKIGENEFAGAMAKRVDTLDGAIAGLKDNWNILFLEISKSGIGDLVKDSVKAASDEVEDFTDLLRSGAIQSALKGISSTFSIFSDGAISDLSDISTSFSDLSKHMIDVWRSTIFELNAIGNTWTTVKALAQKAGVNVAAGVDIFSDPFNRGTTNQQKEDNRKDLLAAIDEEALNNWDGVSKGFEEAEKKRKAYQAKLEADRKKEQEDRLAQFKLKQDGSAPKSTDKDAEKKANDEKRQAQALTQAKYDYEKKLIDQQQSENQQRYKNEEINFVEYANAKTDLNQKLNRLEISYIDQQAAKATQHERTLLEYKRKNIDTESAAKQDALLQEFNQYMANLEQRKKAILDVISDNNVELANLNDFENSLLQVSKRFDETRKKVDELKKVLGDNIAVDFTLPNGTVVKLSKELIDGLQNQLNKQQFEIEAKINLTNTINQIQKDIDKILSDKQYYDQYYDIQEKQNPMKKLEIKDARRQSARNAGIDLQTKQNDLIDLQNSPEAANMTTQELEELTDKIRNLDIAIQEMNINSATAFQEFSANFKQATNDALASGLNTFFNDLIDGSKSAGEALKDFVRNFVKAIAQIIIQALAAYAALLILNAIPGGAAVAKAMDVAATVKHGADMSRNANNARKVSAGQHHTGGVAGTSGVRRNIDLATFSHAPRYHTGGVAGFAPNEVPAILERGEEVLTKNDPRHVANGGGATNMSVRVINQIQDTEIHDAVATPAGERTIVNIIGRNAGAIRRVLEEGS